MVDVPTFDLRRNVFFPLSKEKLVCVQSTALAGMEYTRYTNFLHLLQVNDPLALQLLYADVSNLKNSLI